MKYLGEVIIVAAAFLISELISFNKNVSKLYTSYFFSSEYSYAWPDWTWPIKWPSNTKCIHFFPCGVYEEYDWYQCKCFVLEEYLETTTSSS